MAMWPDSPKARPRATEFSLTAVVTAQGHTGGFQNAWGRGQVTAQAAQRGWVRG